MRDRCASLGRNYEYLQGTRGRLIRRSREGSERRGKVVCVYVYIVFSLPRPDRRFGARRTSHPMGWKPVIESWWAY